MIRAVIFDFDYTLGDSSTGIIECANYALHALGIPTATDDHICRTIGLSLWETYRELAGGAFAEEQGVEFIRLFVERADQVMVDQTRIYEPVPKVFRYLKENGYHLGIVSTKFRFRIDALLERDGLKKSVDLVIGGEDVMLPKPDPEGLNKALDVFEISLEECLYVGDSVIDAETARRAGTHFIPVLTGVTEAEAFDPFHPGVVMKSLSELPRILSDWGRMDISAG